MVASQHGWFVPGTREGWVAATSQWTLASRARLGNVAAPFFFCGRKFQHVSIVSFQTSKLEAKIACWNSLKETFLQFIQMLSKTSCSPHILRMFGSQFRWSFFNKKNLRCKQCSWTTKSSLYFLAGLCWMTIYWRRPFQRWLIDGILTSYKAW